MKLTEAQLEAMRVSIAIAVEISEIHEDYANDFANLWRHVEALQEENERLENNVEGLTRMISGLQKITALQAKDEGLWFDAQCISEGYLQAALRHLHHVIESLQPALPDRWESDMNKMALEYRMAFIYPDGDTKYSDWMDEPQLGYAYHIGWKRALENGEEKGRKFKIESRLCNPRPGEER